jgi:ribonuclease HI
VKDETATIHIDGASRGNPGEAAFAVVIDVPGRPPIEEAGALGKETNNVAEYTALLPGPSPTTTPVKSRAFHPRFLSK